MSEALSNLKKKRKIKQVFMGLIFLIFLIFGWVNHWLGYFIPGCMLFGIVIAFSEGRKWCNYYCPRGSFYDSMIKSISPEKKIPEIFKKLPLRSGIFSFLMIVMVAQIVLRWPDTYSIGKLFMILLTVTTIIGIILAVFIHQRTWCYVCPIGCLGNWIGKGKKSLKINSDLCMECKVCSKVCPVQIRQYEYKSTEIQTVKDADCLKCGLCVEVCSTKALSFPE